MKLNKTLTGVLALVATFWILIFGQRWIPVHDTLVSLLWSHQFVAATQNGEGWGAWIPQVNWGQPLSFPVLAWVSPSVILLTPFTKLFAHPNVVNLFYGALFIDELVLIIGTYLLARQLFKRNLTVFAVTILVAGSVNWSSQIFFNFRIYYAMPLALYFAYTGMRTKSFIRYTVGWAVIPLTAMYGSLFYVALLQAAMLVVFTGFGLHHFGWFKFSFGKHERRNFALLAGLIALSLLLPALLLSHGEFPGIVSPGRGAGGLTNYETFLNWVSDPHFASFGDAFDGVGEEFDSSIFGGIMFFPFIAIALLFAPFRPLLPFLGASAFLFLFSLGKAAFLAPLLYYVPGFSHYRHITYAVPLLKILLMFVAGFGIERFFDSLVGKSRERRKLLMCALAFTVATLVLSLWHYRNYSRMGVPFSSHRMLLVLTLRVSVALIFLRLLINHQKFAGLATALLVTIFCVDIFSYRALRYSEKLVALDKEAWALFQTRLPSFQTTRSEKGLVRYPFNQFLPYSEKLGVLYAVTDAFLNAEPCLHVGRSDVATQGVAKIYPRSGKLPRGLKSAVGCDLPKLYVANKLEIVPTEEVLKERFQIPQPFRTIYATGDDFSNYRLHDEAPLPASSEGDASTMLQKYESDRLEIRIDSSHPTETWLYYADAWHPDWKATVDGKSVPILKANLAFKAIRIPPGSSKVVLRYHSPITQFLSWGIWLLLGGFYATILGLVVKNAIDFRFQFGGHRLFAKPFLTARKQGVGTV